VVTVLAGCELAGKIWGLCADDTPTFGIGYCKVLYILAAVVDGAFSWLFRTLLVFKIRQYCMILLKTCLPVLEHQLPVDQE
jgi:hypothetical protein